MTSAQIHFAASILVALFTLTWVGNVVCKALLDWSGLTKALKNKPPPTQDPAPSAPIAPAVAPTPSPAPASVTAPVHPRVGHLIGAFERLLIAVGLLAGSWEILAAVVALKTVARFKELDEKLDAEYFLVGSLFSVAWAIAVTYGWVAYDHCWGLDLATKWQKPS
jgi:hypothetical protein